MSSMSPRHPVEAFRDRRTEKPWDASPAKLRTDRPESATETDREQGPARRTERPQARRQPISRYRVDGPAMSVQVSSRAAIA